MCKGIEVFVYLTLPSRLVAHTACVPTVVCSKGASSAGGSTTTHDLPEIYRQIRTL